jgi:hypothetical protein
MKNQFEKAIGTLVLFFFSMIAITLPGHKK